MLSDKELVKYCYATYYSDKDKFDEFLGLKNQTEVYFGDSVHKYTVSLPDCYVICFRGSVNKFDWINDFTFKSTEYNHVNVHQGFFSGFASILEPKFVFDKPVIICGHSLGAAYATLEAYRLASLGTKPEQVVLFGSPLVGAKSFVEDWKKKELDKVTALWVNGDDIVPSLPFARYYTTPGSIYHVGLVHAWYNPLKYYHMIHDHHIERYCDYFGVEHE